MIDWLFGSQKRDDLIDEWHTQRVSTLIESAVRQLYAGRHEIIIIIIIIIFIIIIIMSECVHVSVFLPPSKWSGPPLTRILLKREDRIPPSNESSTSARRTRSAIATRLALLNITSGLIPPWTFRMAYPSIKW